jgi:hypothetical protein
MSTRQLDGAAQSRRGRETRTARPTNSETSDGDPSAAITHQSSHSSLPVGPGPWQPLPHCPSRLNLQPHHRTGRVFLRPIGFGWNRTARVAFSFPPTPTRRPPARPIFSTLNRWRFPSDFRSVLCCLLACCSVLLLVIAESQSLLPSIPVMLWYTRSLAVCIQSCGGRPRTLYGDACNIANKQYYKCSNVMLLLLVYCIIQALFRSCRYMALFCWYCTY